MVLFCLKLIELFCPLYSVLFGVSSGGSFFENDAEDRGKLKSVKVDTFYIGRKENKCP